MTGPPPKNNNNDQPNTFFQRMPRRLEARAFIKGCEMLMPCGPRCRAKLAGGGVVPVPRQVLAFAFKRGGEKNKTKKSWCRGGAFTKEERRRKKWTSRVVTSFHQDGCRRATSVPTDLFWLFRAPMTHIRGKAGHGSHAGRSTRLLCSVPEWIGQTKCNLFIYFTNFFQQSLKSRNSGSQFGCKDDKS